MASSSEGYYLRTPSRSIRQEIDLRRTEGHILVSELTRAMRIVYPRRSSAIHGASLPTPARTLAITTGPECALASTTCQRLSACKDRDAREDRRECEQ